MAACFETEDELKARVLRYFGHPTICVELTEDQVNDALADAKRWFMDRVGGVPMLMFKSVADGQVEFELEASVSDVMEVVFPDLNLFQMLAPEIFDTTIPVSLLWFDVGGYGEGGLSGLSTDTEDPIGQGIGGVWPNSGVYQVLQSLETSRRILSADNDWDYDQYSRILRIFPNETAYSSLGASTIIIEYLSNEWDVACLSPAECDVLYRRFLIEVMYRLGEIRTKYDSFPVPGGERSLNGDSLLQRAETREQELNEYVLNRFKPAFFLAE